MKKYIVALALFFAAVAGGFFTTYAADKKMHPLFDGKSLEGWTVRGGTATYKVEDGAVLGKTVDGSPNTFLCTNKDYGDFELEFDTKCDPKLNSGCQIRSHVHEKDSEHLAGNGKMRKHPAGSVFGYQCEVCNQTSGLSGNFWDEGRRSKWLCDVQPGGSEEKAFKLGEWNHFRIVAQGDRVRSWVNGVPVADFTDDMDKTGFIGLQVHGIKAGTGPYEVRWKNINLRELSPNETVN